MNEESWKKAQEIKFYIDSFSNSVILLVSLRQVLSILTCTPAFSAFITKVLVAAVEQGLLALPRVFFSSFDKSVHNKAGGGDGDAWAFKLS